MSTQLKQNYETIYFQNKIRRRKFVLKSQMLSEKEKSMLWNFLMNTRNMIPLKSQLIQMQQGLMDLGSIR